MKKIKAAYPLVPVYIISGEALSEEKLEAIHENAERFLKKAIWCRGNSRSPMGGKQFRETLLRIHAVVDDEKLARQIAKEPTHKPRGVSGETWAQVQNLFKQSA